MTPEEIQEHLERIPDVDDRVRAREFIAAEPIAQRIDLFLMQQRTQTEVAALRVEFREAMHELVSMRARLSFRQQAAGFGYTTVGLVGLAVAAIRGWIPDPH